MHAYFSLDWAIVWEIADTNLPELEQHVTNLLRHSYPDIARVLEEVPPPEDEAAEGSEATATE